MRLQVEACIAGIKLPDSLRDGCVDMIPAANLFDPQVRIYELMP